MVRSVGAGALLLAVLAGGWIRLSGRRGPSQPLKTTVVGRHPTGIAVDARRPRGRH